MFNAKAYMTKASAFKGLAGSATFLAVALLIATGQWAIVTFGGTMFSVVPLSASVWCEIVVATSLVLVVPEVVKACKALYKRFSNKY
jgi:Ca2+-transporting ATPase